MYSFLPHETWISLTHFGAAGLVLPLVLMAALGLWLEGSGRAALVWFGTLGLAAACVIASKVAFAGWGLGSAALDFTGISGHTMLASAVFPVLLGWLLMSRDPRRSANGVGVGLFAGMSFGCVVGCSRVVIGAHSWSEVIAGWLLGTAAGVVSCRAMLLASALEPLLLVRLALIPVIVSLAGMSQTLAARLPTRDWEIRVALALSGRDHPYQRARFSGQFGR